MGYGNFGGGFNMQSLMKQAQKMQDDMQKKQEELSLLEIEGTSGGGMVKVIMSGKKDIKSISLSRDVVDPDDVEMLEDLIVAAINEASQKVDEHQKSILPAGMPF